MAAASIAKNVPEDPREFYQRAGGVGVGHHGVGVMVAPAARGGTSLRNNIATTSPPGRP